MRTHCGPTNRPVVVDNTARLPPEWPANFSAAVPAVHLEFDVPAASLCTWRVGGPLAVVAHATTLGEVEDLARALPVGIPTLVVGRGSNLLVSDAGFGGLTIVLAGEFTAIDFHSDGANAHIVTAGGAVALPQLARRCAARGFVGLEFFVGIPGSVGGAVRMNAGGHGRETCDVVLDATVVDLTSATTAALTASELEFGYRHSNVATTHLVASARFLTSAGDVAACETALDEIVRWRRSHQPGGANAGSVFANPADASAGQLIEECGLKGFQVGGAFVSPKHANFIQTEPTATASDVVAVIRHVRATVAALRQRVLHTEVRLVGHPPNIVEELQT